jgi:dihydroflavonol-4-reductase
VRGDILDRDSLVAAMSGCEVVYHVAGVNGFCFPDPAVLYRGNVDGTRITVAAAGEAGVRRVVYTSSAATIGEPEGTVATERTRHRGRWLSHYERSKHEAERVAFATAAQARVELISVNPASVQGPGRTRGTAKILIDALNGRLRMVVDSRLSIVDVADCAEGHLLAEERGEPGERYLLSGATLTVREAVDLLNRIAGLRERPRRLPPRVAMGMAGAVETAARLRGRRPPVCREMVRTILHGHRYDGSRAARELGLAYTPIEESLRRAVRWYVSQGLVTRPLPGPAASA